jgi:translation initiation factor IF-2
VKKKIRIYELAKELDKTFNEIKDILDELNVSVKSPFSTIDEETADVVKEIFEENKKTSKGKKETKEEDKLTTKLEKKKDLKQLDFTISKLSKLCQVTEREIELKLLKYGVVVDSYDSIIPDFAAKNIIELYNIKL